MGQHGWRLALLFGSLTDGFQFLNLLHEVRPHLLCSHGLDFLCRNLNLEFRFDLPKQEPKFVDTLGRTEALNHGLSFCQGAWVVEDLVVAPVLHKEHLEFEEKLVFILIDELFDSFGALEDGCDVKRHAAILAAVRMIASMKTP